MHAIIFSVIILLLLCAVGALAYAFFSLQIYHAGALNTMKKQLEDERLWDIIAPKSLNVIQTQIPVRSIKVGFVLDEARIRFMGAGQDKFLEWATMSALDKLVKEIYKESLFDLHIDEANNLDIDTFARNPYPPTSKRYQLTIRIAESTQKHGIKDFRG